MRNRRKNFITAAILVIMVLAMTACGQKFDASGYVQACMDLLTQGKTESYMEYTKQTEEEAKADYDQSLDQAMSMMEGIGLSDELMEKYRGFFGDLLAKTKYTVKEAQETEDGFTVDVEVEQLTGVFNGVQAQLQEEAMAYATEQAEAGEQLDEDALQEWIFNRMYEILVEKLDSATYNEAQTITVHVTKKDSTYTIPDEDYATIEAALYDLGDM